MIEEYVDNFKEIVKIYNPDHGIDKTLQYNLKQVYDKRIDFTEAAESRVIPEAKWIHQQYAVRLLKTLPFFKRLPEKTI